MNEISLKGTAYDFSDDYDSIGIENIVNIHRFSMKNIYKMILKSLLLAILNSIY